MTASHSSFIEVPSTGLQGGAQKQSRYHFDRTPHCDRPTNTGPDHMPRYRMASRGKNEAVADCSVAEAVVSGVMSCEEGSSTLVRRWLTWLGAGVAAAAAAACWWNSRMSLSSRLAWWTRSTLIRPPTPIRLMNLSSPLYSDTSCTRVPQHARAELNKKAVLSQR